MTNKKAEKIGWQDCQPKILQFCSLFFKNHDAVKVQINLSTIGDGV